MQSQGILGEPLWGKGAVDPFSNDLLSRQMNTIDRFRGHFYDYQYLANNNKKRISDIHSGTTLVIFTSGT